MSLIIKLILLELASTLSLLTTDKTPCFVHLWSYGLVVKVLDSQSRGPISKPLGGSKVDSAFHPSEVNQNEYHEFLGTTGKK